MNVGMKDVNIILNENMSFNGLTKNLLRNGE